MSMQATNTATAERARTRTALPEQAPALTAVALLCRTVTGVCLGLQIMLVAVVLAAPYPRTVPVERLTQRGENLSAPDLDIPVYLMSCVLTVAVTIVLVRALARALRSQPAAGARSLAMGVAAIETPIALGTLAACCAAFVRVGGAVLDAGWVSGSQLALVATPPLVLGVFVFNPRLGKRLGRRIIRRFRPLGQDDRPPRDVRTAGAIEKEAPATKDTTEGSLRAPAAKNRAHLLFDALVLAAVFAVVYVPDWRFLAGQAWDQDFLHHWDFFAMGPTLALRKGAALGTEAYTQYGVGWPLVFHALSSVMRVSYGTMLHVATLYGVVYFVAVYALLRLWLRDVAWAAVGTALAIALHLFAGMQAGEIVWVYPGSTIMRSPIDVWLFMALLMDLRATHRRWPTVAGALAGLAVVMETDTGLYAAATFAFYRVCTAISRRAAGERPARAEVVRSALRSIAPAVAVAVVGLGIAGRWTVLTLSFWTGWLEALPLYGAGISQLPLAGVGGPGLVLFVLIVGTYLVAVSRLVARVLRAGADRWDFIFGTLGFYGALDLLWFLGRSNLLNLSHVVVPFCLMAAGVGCRVWHRRRSTTRSPQPGFVGLAARAPRIVAHPLALLVAIGVMVAAAPHWGHYPSLLRQVSGHPATGGRCLFTEHRDVCGLPASSEAETRDHQMVAAAAKRLATRGRSAVIVDEGDTAFYFTSDLPPWGRYVPLLTSVMTTDQLARALRDLREHPPDYAFFATRDRRRGWNGLEDVRGGVRSVLQEQFVRRDDVGRFELWERVTPSPPSPAGGEGRGA